VNVLRSPTSESEGPSGTARADREPGDAEGVRAKEKPA